MGLSEDLNEAARLATREMIDFLSAEKGLSREEAYMLCSLAADLHVTQAVDQTKGVHMTIAKAIVNPVRTVRDSLPETGTFSIIAYDTATGEWGGAVQSRVFSVGNGVLSAEAGVGVVATQAVVDVSYGPQALALLRQGKSAAEVVKYVWDHDPDPDTARWAKTGRQFAVVDRKGNVAAYTGPTAPTAAGDKQGVHVTAQGNTLADKSVVDSMVAAFNRTGGQLAFRLLAGIEAGQAAGGDKRGKQSAAMIIVKKCGGVWLHNDVVLKLQVDDSPEPIVELRRLVEKAPLPPRSVTNAGNDSACR
jgi:uncharacterized Ntn-hydrolase superfamily protein